MNNREKFHTILLSVIAGSLLGIMLILAYLLYLVYPLIPVFD